MSGEPKTTGGARPGDAEWLSFVDAAKAYANHLDQWEKVKWQTHYGMVYLTIGRADPYPDSFEEIPGE